MGEDVLITGAGPIGCMAAAIARQAGARKVVVTDVNPDRLALAEKMGATRTVDVGRNRLAEVQKEIGMKEGFDIGLEMSGQASALNDMIDNMAHGGRIALLGIMPGPAAIDWNKVVFNMLTIRGIYGRVMYETWYKMTVADPGRAGYFPDHHPSAALCGFRARIRAHALGQKRQDHPQLGIEPIGFDGSPPMTEAPRPATSTGSWARSNPAECSNGSGSSPLRRAGESRFGAAARS